MTKKKKRLVLAAAALGIFVVIFISLVAVTSHSKFCSTCHYMKPFFQSWETSSHSQFECSVCHYPPGGGIQSKLRKKIEGLVMVGRYWTKLYVKSKPWAEIRDESCLRKGCHEKRLLDGRVQFKKVAFDHTIHFSDLKRGKRLQCTSCHSQIVQGKHISVTESSCFICHFKESEHYPRIADCSHCHHRDDLISGETSRYNHTLVFDNGFSCDKCHSNTILGDGEVPIENCYKCHWEQERLARFNDTDLIHASHIHKNKIECNQCHMEIQHKIIKDIEAIADCKSCHIDFHRAQKILYVGEGGKGISHPMPNVMLEKGLSCKGCHILHEEKSGELVKSDTYVSEAEACESCHGKGFSLILEDWKISTAKKLNKIRSIYDKTAREVERSQHKNKGKAQSLLNDAGFNIELVEKGKSVHNVTFSQELLNASYNAMLEALSTIDSPFKPEVFAVAAYAIPTQCSNCHAGIEEISGEIFGLSFPHKEHVIGQKMECSRCHSSVRKHGEFIFTKQSCSQCHHKNSEKDCAQCHTLQKAFYQGGLVNGFEVPKDAMFEADVGCSDCHLDIKNKIFRSDRTKCAGCHGEGYAEMFDEWQNTVRDLTASITIALKEKKTMKLTLEEQEIAQKIERAVQKIKLDGSSGIHNYFFVEEILIELKKQLESLAKITG